MKIAVTGGTGFVGRHIIAQLTAAGHTCRAWSHRAVAPDSNNVSWLPGQLGDVDSAQALVAGADVLVHAALDRPGRGFRQAEGDVVPFAERNLIGTLQLFEAARRADVSRVVFISTCAVHEKILDDRLLDECHPLWPTNHYGALKAALEAFVHSYGFGSGWPICSLRPCGVYGLADPIQQSKWFELVRKVAGGEPVECRGGGKVVHAADVARAVEILLRAEDVAMAGESFNCCERYVSDWEVAEVAKHLSGSTAEIRRTATRPRHQIETTRLRRLGFEFSGEPLFRETMTKMLRAAASG